jgi:hypothetical protein
MNKKNGHCSVSGKIFAFFMVCIFSCFSQFANAAETLAPDATVIVFYKWYLHSIKVEAPPTLKDRQKLARFVSRSLIKEIDDGAGENADYFTKAQDFFDDWEGSISIKKTSVDRNRATVVVAIGSTKASYQEMTVILRKEGQFWKIRKIPREGLLRSE